MEELANYSNLTSKPSSPTRKNRALDRVYCLSPELYLRATVIPTTVLSDHKRVICEPQTPPENQSMMRKFRGRRKYHVEQFQLALERTNSSFITQIQNTDEAIHAPTSVLRNLLDIDCPW